MQRPGRLVLAVLEEVGADWLRERRIVELDRDEVAGFVAGSLPASADLRAFLGFGVNAVIRRVLGLAGFGRDAGDVDVLDERGDVRDLAAFLIRDFSDLCHAILLCLRLR